MSGPPPLTHEQRIARWCWNYIVDSRGCWLWLGARDPKGYAIGQLPRGHGPRTVRIHRVLYEEFVESVPDGFVLHHKCEVRHCVNPEHLTRLTRGEHLDAHDHRHLMADLNRAKREAATTCKHGHPWNEENTYHCPDGSRYCRACGRIRANRLWAEKRYARQRIAA